MRSLPILAAFGRDGQGRYPPAILRDRGAGHDEAHRLFVDDVRKACQATEG
ncbi:hypothetical protein [Mycobacterium parmense]|uniref:Uncharacterized protein n=1 Tax=Mycobacterium parmense TaxID=185642 RepID=A0A7I7YTZ6_9MYCO|nr:hypothetical protein [Mycobacterium parmense]MCV7351194.1 hypothetical protein [Mycobacterium parmense]BBZ45356.1 hypothetical protein MPRM_26370 [Mycobacterium parmense]